MRRIRTIRDQEEWVEARKRELGITDAGIAAARNKGTARPPEKHRLLQLLKDEAARQGRKPPFDADF
jgi:hypothetical protein